MEERFEQTEQRVDQHGELIAELRTATLTNTQNLDRLTLNSEQHGELIAELRAATLTNTQNLDRVTQNLERLTGNSEQHGELIAELRTATFTNTQNLDRLMGISERFINVATDSIVRLDQNITELRTTAGELRASNQRQERINDYLIRRDQERNNGNPG